MESIGKSKGNNKDVETINSSEEEDKISKSVSKGSGNIDENESNGSKEDSSEDKEQNNNPNGASNGEEDDNEESEIGLKYPNKCCYPLQINIPMTNKLWEHFDTQLKLFLKIIQESFNKKTSIYYHGIQRIIENARQ